MTWLCQRCGYLAGRFPDCRTFELRPECFNCRDVQISRHSTRLLAKWKLKLHFNSLKVIPELTDKLEFIEVVNQLHNGVMNDYVAGANYSQVLLRNDKIVVITPRSVKITSKM